MNKMQKEIRYNIQFLNYMFLKNFNSIMRLFNQIITY